jgi:hypothetical protein
MNRSGTRKEFIMAVQQGTIVCCRCKKPVTFHVDPVNHLKQFALSLATLGLWLPMWLLLTFVKVKVCDECGNPAEEAK